MASAFRLPPRPPDLFDREAEWARLGALFASPRSELALVLGRRRVGKTFLLAPFAGAVGGIYYQATRRTAAEQRGDLVRLVRERFEDPALEHASFGDWGAFFRYLLARADGAPFLVVLDEFPYLVEASPELPSVLQTLLDHEARASRMKLVLSGSAISAMQKLEAADQPLYARRTARMVVAPFGPREAGAFLALEHARDRLRAYAAFGGLPGHLVLFDSSADLAANVAQTMLDPQARLYDEAEHMLDAFLGEAQVHYSILAAIAGGAQTWGELTKVVGKPGGSLSRPLDWLLEMEFVRRVVPVTQADTERRGRALYRIRDPYVAFWHRFIAPVVRRGGPWLGTPGALYAARVGPHLDDWVGPVFEEVCRRVLPSLDGLPFPPTHVGEWWSRHEQVDVVALGEGDDVLVGEAKWGTVDRHHLAALRRKAARLAAELDRPARLHLVLFSGRGLADRETRLAVARGEVRHVGVAELMGMEAESPSA